MKSAGTKSIEKGTLTKGITIPIFGRVSKKETMNYMTNIHTVWADPGEQKNVELCFSCRLKQSRNITIELVARDIYNLFVNGKFVSYGPSRAAKGYCRVDRLDISPYLTEEDNLICVYVQSNFTNSLCFVKEEPLFGACIIHKDKILKQTRDFRCSHMTDKLSKVERMSSQRGFLEVYHMSADRLNAQFPVLETRPVECPRLLDRCVSFAKNALISAHCIKSGRAYADSDEKWENDFIKQLDTGERLDAFRRDECDCVLSKELLSFRYTEEEPDRMGYQIFEFDKVHCGKFKLQLKVREKTHIWLTYDDILVDDYVKFNREHIIHGIKWTLEEGTYTLYSQEVYTAKYIQIMTQGEADIEEISVICIENPDADHFAMPALDGEMQTIVDAAKNAFAQNAYDLFTDCPSRERAGWLCDSYFLAKAELFFTGDNKVEKNFLENYLLFENDVFKYNGIMPMCYPSEVSRPDRYIPNWILWYVLELEDYRNRTGDVPFIARHTQRIRDILEYFSRYENEYGLLENLEGWVFLEWSRATDFTDGVNFPSNMLYAEALRAAGTILDDHALLKKAKTLKTKILQMSYNGTVFIDNAVRVDGKLELTGNISELCQIFAQYFDIAPEDTRFRENFKNSFRETGYEVSPAALFIGGVLRLMALFQMGEYRLVLDECEEKFWSMAERTGTIWEFFDEQASCNHGFGSVIGKLICESAELLKAKGEKMDEAS